MSGTRISAAMLLMALAQTTPASAQQMPFTRTFAARAGARVDVVTDNGKIEIVKGPAESIVVAGAATVRVGWNVPADAIELARQVALAPPITEEGSTIRLRTPSDARAARAVTVSYRVTVPADTEILSTSDSGETTVGGIAGRLTVRTRSAAITLTDIGGDTTVTTGSGAATVTRAAGHVSIETGSSAIVATNLSAGLRVRTGSGAVSAELTGPGDVDVDTHSSGVRIVGPRGAVRATSGSGRLFVRGTPGGAWDLVTSSGGVEVELVEPVHATLDAKSRSGSVKLERVSVQGEIAKNTASGTIGGGGPQLRIAAGSGSVRIVLRQP